MAGLHEDQLRSILKTQIPEMLSLGGSDCLDPTEASLSQCCSGSYWLQLLL